MPDAPDSSDDPPRWPTYAVIVAVLLVVVLVTAWVAGRQSAPPGTGSTDAVRLGPVAGESVPAYLARVRTVPPGPGPPLALVQFDAPLDAATSVAALRGSGATPVAAVFRVPFPRVQTAVRRFPVLAGRPDVAGVLAAETQAAEDARSQATGATGRVGDVARAESAALAARCGCVLALVVTLDPGSAAGLTVPPVRAVQVAPPGARPEALAVSPLLPEQHDVVGPVPDDGPVP